MRIFASIFVVMISMSLLALNEEDELLEEEPKPFCTTLSLGKARALTIVSGITGISVGALMAGAGCLSTPTVPGLCVGGIAVGSIFGVIFFVGTGIVGCCQFYNAKIAEPNAPPLNRE
jgi:hypothetical protein